MSQHVRRELLAEQSGTTFGSRFRVSLEDVGNAPSAQWLTAKTDEHLRGSGRAAHRQPSAQRCGRTLPQRKHSLSPSLAINENARRWQRDIVEPQPGQLRYA